MTELDEAMDVADPRGDDGLLFDDVAKLHRCLDALKPYQKDVLLLRFIEQMSYEQIAEVVDCCVGTVRSRIHHAKRALKQKLEEL